MAGPGSGAAEQWPRVAVGEDGRSQPSPGWGGRRTGQSVTPATSDAPPGLVSNGTLVPRTACAVGYPRTRLRCYRGGNLLPPFPHL